MKKVMLIFGTRPEAIKMAPLIKVVEGNKNLQCITCVTGQHREMLDQVLKVFNIKPNYDLNIMTKDQTLSSITYNLLPKLDNIIKNENPDIVIVQGDTTTAFIGALVAFYNKIPVGHVEAGLRTYDKYNPFPEETNRAMITQIADFHFCPSTYSYSNLIKENVDKNKIYITGNTVVDAMRYTVVPNYNNDILEWAKESDLVFLTAHRRENVGNSLENIFTAINEITKKYDNIKIVYPVHLNPVIKDLASKYFSDNEKIRLIDPLDVVNCHNILKKASFIITDSGGIQEEAVSLGKRVIVLREKTERPEGIETGNLKIVGTNTQNIIKAVDEVVNESKNIYSDYNPYGDGFASKKIVDIIVDELCNKNEIINSNQKVLKITKEN